MNKSVSLQKLQMDSTITPNARIDNSQFSVMRNDIKEIKTARALERLNLDLESPRLREACRRLGIDVKECEKKSKDEFEGEGISPDVVNMRYNHFKARLIDTLNKVLEERRNIKMETQRDHKVKARSPPPFLENPEPKSSGSINFFITGTDIEDQREKEFTKYGKITGDIQSEIKRRLENDEIKRIKHESFVDRMRKTTSFEESKDILWKRKAVSNQQKREEMALKIKMLEREREHVLESANQRRIEDAQRRDQKLRELAAEMEARVKDKEALYIKKREKILKYHVDIGEIQKHYLELKLKEIDKKLRETQARYQQRIREKVIETHNKNEEVEEKIMKFQIIKKQVEEQKVNQIISEHQDDEKRIKVVYKEVLDLWSKFKDKKRERRSRHLENMSIEEQLQLQKTMNLKSKMQKMNETIENNRRIRDHELMLKREYQRLKEFDTLQTKERQKRLELAKKERIMQKHFERSQSVQQLRDYQREMQKTRTMVMLQSLRDRERMISTTQRLTHSIDTPRKKNKLLKEMKFDFEFPIVNRKAAGLSQIEENNEKQKL